jgi:hypothetical protein
MTDELVINLHRISRDQHRAWPIRLRGGAVDLSAVPPKLRPFLQKFRCGPYLGIEDGEPWLRALPVHLRGSYLWASPAPTDSLRKVS